MLSLLRLLFFLGVIGGAGYGALYVLAEVLEPPQKEIVEPISPGKFNQ